MTARCNNSLLLHSVLYLTLVVGDRYYWVDSGSLEPHTEYLGVCFSSKIDRGSADRRELPLDMEHDAVRKSCIGDQ